MSQSQVPGPKSQVEEDPTHASISSCLPDLLVYGSLALAILGLVIGHAWLAIPFAVLLIAAAMYGVVGAVAIPVWTLRHWRELGWGRRIIYVLVAVFCLGMLAQTLWLAIQLRRS